MLRSMVSVVAVLVSIGVLQARQDYPPSLTGSERMVYKTVGDVELALWLFTPAAHEPQTDRRPAVVFFFGGGWRAGNPGQFEAHCRYLASRGMVAATADYRVASRHDVKAVDCVQDAKSAVRWLRTNAAELGIDPHRIAAGGGSAGGHLAACTALIAGHDAAGEDVSVSSVPDAMALFNPAVMLAGLDGFGRAGISAEKIDDIATRTGVPAADISPIHHVRPGMPPTIIFHGMADTTVPYATVQEFTKRMQAAGNRCQLSGFAGAPHGFFNVPKGRSSERRDQADQWHRRTVRQMDDFFQSLGWLSGDATVRVADLDFAALRGDLENSFQKFSETKSGHVAFLGGSITEMNGYRPIVCEWLQNRFPDTEFTFTNAGISSTCSTTGAFRLQRDVFAQGPVDLLLVEFAVNDDQDAFHSAQNCVRGMEGIVRHTRLQNPHADIVMTHFVNPGMIETLQAGKEIVSASQHEHVARHYHVSSSYLSKALAQRIADGTMTWEQFGGTHPKRPGNQLAADMVTAILEAGWTGLTTENLSPRPHTVPEPLDETSYAAGRLLPPDSAVCGPGWSVSVPDWKNIPGAKRQRFVSEPVVHAQTAGSELQLMFRGTAVGAYLLAGPDAGQLQVQIDGGPFRTVETYHHYSKGLHYPRTVMFASELPSGEHQLTLRVAETKHDDSQGHAIRIMAFAVNQP
ncbi:MAG: alpha/beta hydrolase fold domain-containing protein [Fuerstiella sp.]